LAAELNRTHLGAAASLREGIAEILPRHHTDQPPSGTTPTGPTHLTDIGTANDAIIGIFSGAHPATSDRCGLLSLLSARISASGSVGR
jgi:hypothetical protein